MSSANDQVRPEAYIDSAPPRASSDRVQHQFEKMRKRVCCVTAGGVTGTGFLITGSHLLMALHTYDDLKKATRSDANVRINFETTNRLYRVDIKMKKFVPVAHGRADKLDYAVFNIDRGISYHLVGVGSPTSNRGWLPLLEGGSACGIGAEVLVCGFPTDEVQYTKGKTTAHGPPTNISYDADTKSGWSGGPVVLLDEIRAAAVHSGNHVSGHANVGAPTAAILAHLRENYPDIYAAVVDQQTIHVRELPTTEDGTVILFRRPIFAAFRALHVNHGRLPILAKGAERQGRTYLAQICRRMFPGDFIAQVDFRDVDSSQVGIPFSGADNASTISPRDILRYKIVRSVLSQLIPGSTVTLDEFLPTVPTQSSASVNDRVATELVSRLVSKHVEDQVSRWIFFDNVDHAEGWLWEFIDEIALRVQAHAGQIFLVLTGSDVPRPSSRRMYNELPLDMPDAAEIQDCIAVFQQVRPTRGARNAHVTPDKVAQDFINHWRMSNYPIEQKARDLQEYISQEYLH